ncbi:MAG TPA: glycerate kinase, partial [Bacteroidales bacterium]|nr:glycerate kinase [Bacteroidales bacterium]
TVVNALGNPLVAQRGSYDNGKLSVIELAQASGLGDLPDKSPLKASTYGTGLQIKKALAEGAEEIILTLGGSATVDGGMGLMAALGARFFDERGCEILKDRNPLMEFSEVDFSGLPDQFFDVKWTILADVDNPVFGRNGGVRTFGPQKGLSDSQIVDLEAKMWKWAEALTHQYEPDMVRTSGSGAAGAVALPFLAKGNVRMENGFNWISKTFGLEKQIENCEVVITGEGKLDLQTEMGKGPGKLAAMARQKGKWTIAVVGYQEVKADLFDHVISLDTLAENANALMTHPAFFLEKAAESVVKLLHSF